MIQITMQCDHSILFDSYPPLAGDVIWCPSCEGLRMVFLAPFSISIKCLDCNYRQYHGQNLERARQQIKQHTRPKPRRTHRVELYDGTLLREVYGERGPDSVIYL